MKKIIFVTSLLLFIFITSKPLLTLHSQMFLAHDETQAARIQQFNMNIEAGNIPPRIAPEFSFGLGYPVFNYYAPFPYWVTELFQSANVSVLTSLKLTYLCALLVGFIGMYLFLHTFFPFYSALLGSFVYATSPYIATDIYVRGNLGEIWVFALLPLSLYLIRTNTEKRIAFTAIILSFLFTAHNILSLVSMAIVLLFMLLLSKRTLNLITFGVSLLLSAYFILPAILELSHVHATNIATKTDYADHFLCLSQVWSSAWGFAGSASGCASDGMSFMLGKIPLLLGSAGILLFLYEQFVHKKNGLLAKAHNVVYALVNAINSWIPFLKNDQKIAEYTDKKVFIYIAVITIGSLYMTIDSSSWIWQVFEPLLSLFQFPWRFLMFTLFGISFFCAYLFSKGTKNIQIVGLFAVILAILVIHPKYFQGKYISTSDFTKTYLSDEYISRQVAYKVAEYVPTTVDFDTWKSKENNPQGLDVTRPVVGSDKMDILVLEDKPFSQLFMAKSEVPVVAQIHYAPYWKIFVEYEEYIPTRFDLLGRPFIPVSESAYTSIQIQYAQTTTEVLANLVTVITSVILIGFIIKKHTLSWEQIIRKT